MFRHNLGDLQRDLSEARREFGPKARVAVRAAAKDGNDDAKAHARLTSREHAKLYPGTFTVEMGPSAGGLISAEYGPEPRGQGLLAPILENGSRNNPPHHDLAQSADRLPANMAARLGLLVSELFW